MTPIFKRTFKKEMLILLYMLVIIVFYLLADTNRISSQLTNIYNAIASSGISAEDFAARKTENERSWFMTEEMNSQFGYAITQNTYDVLVPDAVEPLMREKDKFVSFGFGMGAALACAAAVSVFASERGRKKPSFVNALPYKRTRLFWERALCGVIVIVLFFAANYIILSLWLRHFIPQARFIAQKLYMDEGYMQSIEHMTRLGEVYRMGAAQALLIYGVMLFAQSLFGRMTYAGILAGGAAAGGIWMIDGIFDFFNYYNMGIGHKLSGYFIALRSALCDRRSALLIFILALALVFTVLAFLCDKKARVERAGELFMFRPVKYLVCLLFAAEGAFAFFHFINRLCQIAPNTLFAGIMLLLAGAVLTLLFFNKLILKEAE